MPFLLMAKDWRTCPEDDDYEELTADELDDPDFLEDFVSATLKPCYEHRLSRR